MCPQIVSCADIIQLAAREAIFLVSSTLDFLEIQAQWSYVVTFVCSYICLDYHVKSFNINILVQEYKNNNPQRNMRF